MLSLLNALYELLSFITEDAVAWKLNQLPPELNKALNELQTHLGNYLDQINPQQ